MQLHEHGAEEVQDYELPDEDKLFCILAKVHYPRADTQTLAGSV